MVPSKITMCGALQLAPDRKTKKVIRCAPDETEYRCGFCGKGKILPRAGVRCDACGAWVSSVDWKTEHS